MLKTLLVVISTCLLVACSGDPVLDLEQTEARARAGEGAALNQLVDLLASSDEQIADRVYAILIEIGGESVPVLSRQLKASDRQQREYVIAALGTLKVTSAIPQISEVLADSSLRRRYVAAWALGEIGDPSGIPALLLALDDDNAEVRRYATRALIKLNRQSVEPLVTYLDTATGEGAAGAIRALGDIADKRALPALLAQTRGAQRGEAYLALGKLRDSRAEQALVEGLTDQNDQVRMNAAMALGPLGGEAAVPPLKARLEDDIHVVREWSARSLEMITGQPVLYRNSKGEMVRPYNVYH